MAAATPGPDPVHLMTIEMGCWCGASGPGNGRASSAWREVTCTDCHAKRTEWLLALAWDMLDTMGPSREALTFAVRAGRLGVTGPDGRPLAMACAPDPHPFAPSDRDATDAQTLHDSPGADLDYDDEAGRADVLRMRREMAREAGDDSPGGDLDDGYPDSERDADALAYQRNGDDERDDQ